ncbi:hypothetical protein COY95_03710, partial [Candidatus Woesearchaeota archaeon CG_4_10_14_0_8_um_filter_47_5]
SNFFEMADGPGNTWYYATTLSAISCPAGGANTPCKLTVVAKDVVGHVTNNTLVLYVDDINPAISGLRSNDTDNISRSTSSVKLNVTASDANIANVTVKSNYTATQYIMTDGPGNFWLYTTTFGTLGCQGGGDNTTCTLTARATDYAGNKNYTYYNLIIDDVNPNIGGLKSNDSDNISRSNIMLNFTVTATDAHIVNVTINSNYSATKRLLKRGAGNVWSLNITLANLGCPTGNDNSSCRITAWATDVVNHKNSTIYTIIVDDKLPVINSLTSNDTDAVSRSDQKLNFTVFATDAHMVNVTITSNYTSSKSLMTRRAGNIWSYAGTPASLSCPSGKEGAYCKITARATDIVGNTNISVYTLIVDDIKPNIAALTSNDTDHISRSNSLLNITVTASDVNLANVTLKSNYSSTQYFMSGSGTTKSYHNVLTSLGCPSGGDSTLCTLTAKATDYALNKNSTSYVITIDDKVPTISSLKSNDTDNVSRSNTMLNFTAIATDAHLVNVSIQSNYSSTKHLLTLGAANKWSLNITPANLGCHAGQDKSYCKITAWATDVVNNKKSTNYTFIVDDIKPSISMLRSNDTDNVSRTDNLLKFMVTATDS